MDIKTGYILSVALWYLHYWHSIWIQFQIINCKLDVTFVLLNMYLAYKHKNFFYCRSQFMNLSEQEGKKCSRPRENRIRATFKNRFLLPLFYLKTNRDESKRLTGTFKLEERLKRRLQFCMPLIICFFFYLLRIP